MKLNLKKALAYMQKDLKKEFGKINFDYELSQEDGIKVSAEVTLNAFDDGIYVVFRGKEGSALWGRAVFDKIDLSYDTLALVNKFNDDSLFFKCYVDSKSYLCFEHFQYCADEKSYVDFASEFLYKLIKLQDSEEVKELTRNTFTD